MFRSKRVKILLAIALLVIAAWTGTTLAAYVKQTSLFSSGWVGPKYYVSEGRQHVCRTDTGLHPMQSIQEGHLVLLIH